ncbi:nickel/cobalt transporter [Aliiroseovarius sp.]|uniref:nickel/cobalt transporter n=1 Tax=Aliiroseovarius sp. TaxID=1872442 RepID=UPI003BA9AA5A
MRLILICGGALVAALAAFLLLEADSLASWAVSEQRAIQNRMAGAVRALRGGEPGALAALLAAAAAYGFVHAVGPGHGKALIGGVGLGSSVSAPRLLALSLASSLVQALWAIALVYGGFFLFETSARRMTTLAEVYLAPVSYLAIATIGLILVWRGGRGLVRQAVASPHGHDTGHDAGHHACGCHAHGPSPEAVEQLRSWRDMAALIASIAIRPCTGALFLLVIAWQMDLRAAGALAVVVMGLGTATFTSLVAVSSVAARAVTFASADRFGGVAQIASAVQVLAGAVILWISLTLLWMVV